MSKKLKHVPDSIRIAGHKIKIETFGLDASAISGIYGAFHGIRNVIIFCDELDKVTGLDTMIHEIGHAIYHFYNITDEDVEERIVNQMGVAWAQVWVDNPDLVKFLNYVVR